VVGDEHRRAFLRQIFLTDEFAAPQKEIERAGQELIENVFHILYPPIMSSSSSHQTPTGLKRLGQVRKLDGLTPPQIRNRTRQLEDTGMSPPCQL
jgi:hypothetical protein